MGSNDTLFRTGEKKNFHRSLVFIGDGKIHGSNIQVGGPSGWDFIPVMDSICCMGEKAFSISKTDKMGI